MMSDDDMQELNELIEEYRSKEKEVEKEQPKQNPTKSNGQNYNEVPMDKVLFGNKSKFIKNLEKVITKNEICAVKADSRDSGDDEVKTHCKNKSRKRKPVWVDADDEEIQLGEVKKETKRTGPLDHLKMDEPYKEYLSSRFTRVVNQPKWASLDREKKQEIDEDELLRTVGFINKLPVSVLGSEHLRMKKLMDINRATYAEGNIRSIQFHPSSTAALVAGDAGVATIYAIDGVQNDKLHNIHIANYPIKCARLLPCGTKAMFGSFQSVAFVYDLMSAKETSFRLKRDYGNLCKFVVSSCGRYLASGGRCGEVHIYEAKTMEIIRTLKQNDDVASLCFTSDSHRLIVSGKSSNVSIFSMRQQRLEHKFVDDGCVVGSAMDLSPNQRLLATGSKEGAVNVYDFEKVMLSSAPQPEKTLLNLTTAISCVRFNHSSELLAFSSSLCQNAVRVAHFPTGTVYANFPTNTSKLDSLRTLEFSPQSAYFAMGSSTKCPLYRIKHFENY